MENRSSSNLYFSTALNCNPQKEEQSTGAAIAITTLILSNSFLLKPKIADPASCPPAFQYPNNCKNP